MDLRPFCKYGNSCYRKNSQHQKQYRHQKRKRSEDSDNELGANKKTIKVVDDENDLVEDEQQQGHDKDCGDKSADHDTESVEEDIHESNTESAEPAVEEDIHEPKSPADIKDNIKQKYLVEFPEDFYQMWEFCKSENNTKPEETFKSTLEFTLVGPFDILAGKHKKKKNKFGKTPNFLLHWRYYYDPPEFTTVINGDKVSQFHLGYFRDDPCSIPDFVASNSAKENGNLIFRGENLFSSIKYYLEEKSKSKGLCSNVKKETDALLKRLCQFGEKNNINLQFKTELTKKRDKTIVCKTFHGVGMVVPVDENEVGYRPVPETPADLKKMFMKIADSKTDSQRDTNFEPLQELITYIQFANDECDYGEGLELGLDLFTYGGNVFHSTILTLLPLAYQLLRRNEYSQIVEAHLKSRRHTADLSELE